MSCWSRSCRAGWSVPVRAASSVFGSGEYLIALRVLGRLARGKGKGSPCFVDDIAGYPRLHAARGPSAAELATKHRGRGGGSVRGGSSRVRRAGGRSTEDRLYVFCISTAVSDRERHGGKSPGFPPSVMRPSRPEQGAGWSVSRHTRPGMARAPPWLAPRRVSARARGGRRVSRGALYVRDSGHAGSGRHDSEDGGPRGSGGMAIAR